jgi:hypothetical protein
VGEDPSHQNKITPLHIWSAPKIAKFQQTN